MKYQVHQTVIFIENEELQEGVIIRSQKNASGLSYVLFYTDPDGNVYTTLVDEENIFSEQNSAFDYVFSVFRETKARYMVKEFLKNISIRDYLQGVTLFELLKHKNLLNNGTIDSNKHNKPLQVCVKG